ncbi:hypothetical protein GCM10010302_19010 [Streptomyces polychromogenes]|uniref:Uncharacterized protein n=1 Tax=Streptomyces polychromogenes TaxID=67342 RepID=A0ABP3EVZ8_9ACTN
MDGEDDAGEEDEEEGCADGMTAPFRMSRGPVPQRWRGDGQRGTGRRQGWCRADVTAYRTEVGSGLIRLVRGPAADSSWW